jgi:DNA-binding NarL/FixJ family response regulator
VEAAAIASDVHAGPGGNGPAGRRFSCRRRLRVMVVDDHEVIQWGLRVALTSEAWVQRYVAAQDAEEALELARRYEPHVALVDLFLGDESGTELCERLREVSPITQVLLMSGVGRITVSAARNAGALGFVPKDWSAKDIAGAARMVALGMTVFSPRPAQSPNILSSREWEVLQLIGAGANNREIASRLFLSPHTVKDHIRSLYRKLEARNRAEAILRAQRKGFLG